MAEQGEKIKKKYIYIYIYMYMPFVNFLKTSSVEVHILLLESSLFFFFAVLCGMLDLSSLTRYQTCTHCDERVNS